MLKAGGAPLWLVVLPVAFLGALGVIFLGSIGWAFRSRIVIQGGKMAVRGLLLTHRIRPERMEGYRYIQGRLHLYLKDRNWPVQPAFYERHTEIDSWVRRRTTDLKQQDILEEKEAIRRDMTLGLTEADKEARLFELRKTIWIFKTVAYPAAVAGVVNFLFLKLESVSFITISVLVSIPILFDFLALRHRGHVRIDYREGTRYPEIFSSSMACGLALSLMSLLDRDLLFWQPFLRWFVPVLLLKAVIWNPTKVLNKRISRGRRVKYVIALEPWSEDIEEPLKVSVPGHEFRNLVVGEPAKIGVRQGALNIPWVFGVKPNEGRMQENDKQK